MKTSFYNFKKRSTVLIAGIIFLTVLFPMQTTFAQTEVAGEVSGVWELEGSPYIAVDNLIVPEGEELIIEPGVEVLFQDRNFLNVLGTLTAVGEPENFIRFSNAQEDPEAWGSGLCFEGDASRASLDYAIIENQIIDTNEEVWLNRGGGIRILGGEHQITHSIIQTCQANIGGGLYLNAALCEVRDSEFVGNHGRSTGGGVFASSGLKLIDCRLSNNSADGEDQQGISTIYIWQQQESADSLVITGCRLEGNLQSGMGAFGIGNLDCPYHLAFNEVINNESPGVVFMNSGFDPALIADHFTVYGNDNAGVWSLGTADAIVTNSILWGNEGRDIAQDFQFNGSLWAANSDIGESAGIDLEDCISIDPRFFDPEGLVDGTTDFRLRADSPCIGAGFEGTDMGANLFEAEEFNQELNFIARWNGVSLRILPQNPDIVEIFQSMVERENLILAKDDHGRFYAPEWRFCNIGNWIYSEGYLVRTIEEDALEIEGILVQPDEPIDLNEGWNVIAYYPEQVLSASVAFDIIFDQAIIAKNTRGNFWTPGFWMDFDMQTGEAYWIKVAEDVRFVYPSIEEEDDERIASTSNLWSNWDEIMTEYSLIPTENTMNMVLKSDNISKASQIIAKSENGEIFGAGICADGYCAMILYGDDEMTSDIDGFTEGSPISLYCHETGIVDIPVRNCVSEKPLTFETNGFLDLDVEVSSLSELPNELTLSGAYPNPFNSVTKISFGLPETSRLSICVYDIVGRQITQLADDEFEAGFHHLFWNAGSIVSGIYFVTLATESEAHYIKVVLVK